METRDSISKEADSTSPVDRPRVTAASSRARVTNGRTLLAGVDGRRAGYRRYRDVLADVMEQTGRRNEALCRRYASLVMQSETLDAMIARGEPVDVDQLVKLSGATAA